MDYTSIHVFGHLLSDDTLHAIERDTTFAGNTEPDYQLDTPVGLAIDYAWTSLRSAYAYYRKRSTAKDPYGTRRSRELIAHLLTDLGWHLKPQPSNALSTHIDEATRVPLIIVGADGADEGSTLDARRKGNTRQRSPHALMLQELAASEAIYGIVANGDELRLLRNTGQLVKLVYISFDLRRMVMEDKYTEFCLLYRILHASRFRTQGDTPAIIEKWFNQSVESGNRIRAGLSAAVRKAMEIVGTAVVGSADCAAPEARPLNDELILFVYRLLFLFIIEERGLVYQLPEADSPDYAPQKRLADIYRLHYAATRLRTLSEHPYLYNDRYTDLWQALLDTFRLFETGGTGATLGITALGGRLFGEPLLMLSSARLTNRELLKAISALNEFTDEQKQRVKINYASLDVEEFGSVYEGILELEPVVDPAERRFGFRQGLDRQATSSYYTRPDLVESLIKTTLQPVIDARLAKATNRQEREQALLRLRVCDPACGSGHVVLAMARTIAWHLAHVRTNEDNPASIDYRRALREVIARCVYAVDLNPYAVELCKVVLWIEGYCAGQPLTFLDHHIRCGNAVVGVDSLQRLLTGVPNEAFKAQDNNKGVLKNICALNQQALQELKSRQETQYVQSTVFYDESIIPNLKPVAEGIAEIAKEVDQKPENTIEEVQYKQQLWEKLMRRPEVASLRLACDIYAESFFHEYTEGDLAMKNQGVELLAPIPCTRILYHALQAIRHRTQPIPTYKPLPEDFCTAITRAARGHRYFHWLVDFPDIFAAGQRFDCVCGNPPWGKIKVEDEKWFERNGRPDIAKAPNQNSRKAMIDRLPTDDPATYEAYRQAQKYAEGTSRFVRFSWRFPLTATGDIDHFPLFAELALTATQEAWGLVLPTGIATNDSNKAFFAQLVEQNRLRSIYDFENREKLFDIHPMFKFCLLTAAQPQAESRAVRGGFFLQRLDHLLDPRRVYTLATADFLHINPNTHTCPIFRTTRDARLTTDIHHRVPILWNEHTGDNPWGVRFSRMIDMSNDSRLFRTRQQLEGEAEPYVPLYEGKMLWHYNHHYGAFPAEAAKRPTAIPATPIESLQDPRSELQPWYWVPQAAVETRLIKRNAKGQLLWQWTHSYYIAFRNITNATNERTLVAAILPSGCGVGHSAPLLFTAQGIVLDCCLAAMLSSLVVDYVARQKTGGSNMTIFTIKQLPILPPSSIPEAARWAIVRSVAELVYWNHDLDAFARELYAALPPAQRPGLEALGQCQPYAYDPERRALLQAELDAIFARLYGLTLDDLRYILLPEDVCGEGCVNETFRVLRDNEQRLYGEYRTRRLVLEAWHRFGYTHG